MGLFGNIFGGIGKAAEGVGTAINKNVKTIKGDVAEREQHTHDEQLAVFNQFAAEFLNRQNRTRWDSLVDGLNRLPRPLLTFGIIWIFIYTWIDPGSMVDFFSVLEIVPDTFWTLLIVIVSFFFGGRFVKEDLARPKISKEQRDKALEIIRKRAEAIEKAKEPDSVVVVGIPPPQERVREPVDAPDLPEDSMTVDAVNQMIESLLQKEGGYVNRVEDRGGPTNMGITLATLADWRGTVCTVSDVRALTKEEAIKIYRANYLQLPGIDTLPRSIQPQVFDIGVHSGPRTAIRMLQKTLNGFGESLIVDGIIGDLTRDACRKYDARKLNNALAEMRLKFYDDIVASNPSQRVFLNGWQRRAKGFMVA